MAKDYYQVLGIEKTDDQEVIKKAYREQAKRLHPDKSKQADAQEVFQQLNEAYMVLSDPDKKIAYDKGSDLPTFTYEQVQEILRKRDRYYRTGDSFFKYQGNNVYPPTDYQANKKNSLLANIIISVVALIFIFDLSMTGKMNAYEVDSVYYVYSGTGNNSDINKYKVFMGNAEVYLYSIGPPVAQGDEVFISFSPIFQKAKAFITPTGRSFNISGRTYVFWIAIIVLAISILGITPILSAERQFNAAVISGFFSVLLLISLLIG